ALLHALRKRRPEVVGIAGLDQHDASNDRGTRVVVHDETIDPLAALKAGHFHNHGSTIEFDPAVGMSKSRRATLVAARWALDVVDGVHERAVRVLRASGDLRR
ncbi:MAG: hypothetical protein M3081_06260, partial [Gemmatimonadota bacterium]|nr:hypothetical protein [Gemmatimonadota bacterium]